MSLYQLTAKELHRKLCNKECSAREVTESVFGRIDACEERVGAYVTLDREGALAAAGDRTAAARTLCAHLQSQAPILPLCFKSSSVLLQAGVLEGLQPTAAEPFYNLKDCVIHLSEG